MTVMFVNLLKKVKCLLFIDGMTVFETLESEEDEEES